MYKFLNMKPWTNLIALTLTRNSWACVITACHPSLRTKHNHVLCCFSQRHDYFSVITGLGWFWRPTVCFDLTLGVLWFWTANYACQIFAETDDRPHCERPRSHCASFPRRRALNMRRALFNWLAIAFADNVCCDPIYDRNLYLWYVTAHCDPFISL